MHHEDLRAPHSLIRLARSSVEHTRSQLNHQGYIVAVACIVCAEVCAECRALSIVARGVSATLEVERTLRRQMACGVMEHPIVV